MGFTFAVWVGEVDHLTDSQVQSPNPLCPHKNTSFDIIESILSPFHLKLRKPEPGADAVFTVSPLDRISLFYAWIVWEVSFTTFCSTQAVCPRCVFVI